MSGTTKEAAIATVLASLPEQERDRMISLMKEAPHMVARLIPGTKAPHKSSMLRSVTRGSWGVRLRTVCQGRKRVTCARWIAEYWFAVAEARLSPKPAAKRKGGGA